MQVEQLIEELAYEDFEISIYGEELEKIKSSPEYKKVTEQIEMADPQSLETKNKLLTNTASKLFKIKFIKDFSAILYKKNAEQGGKTYHNFSGGEVYQDVYIFPNDAGMVDVKAEFADGYIYLPKDIFEIVEDTDTNNLVKGDLVEIEFKFPPGIKEYDFHTEQEGIFTAEVDEKYNVYILEIDEDYVDVQLEAQMMDTGSKLKGLKKTDFKVIGKIGGDEIPQVAQQVAPQDPFSKENMVKIKFIKNFHGTVTDHNGKVHSETFNTGDIKEVEFFETVGNNVKAAFLDGAVWLNKDFFEIIWGYKLSEPITIQFNKEYSSVVTTGTDKNGDPIEEDELFHKGDTHNVNVVEDAGDYIHVQFEDGSVLNGLNKNDFNVIGTGSPKPPKNKTTKPQKDVYKDKLMSGILVKIKFNENYNAVLFPKEDAGKEYTTNHTQNYKTGEVIEIIVLKNGSHTISCLTTENYITTLPKEVFEVAK